MDWNFSDDAVGALLVGLTVLLLLISWALAHRGLVSTDRAAKEAAEAARKAKEAAAGTQTALAAAGASAPELATAQAELVQNVSSIDSAVSEVNAALGELKGVFTPTRAFLAFAILAFTASLIAFDLVSVDLSPESGGNTPTETTP